MRLILFSRGPSLYSTQSLFRAGRKRTHSVTIVDHTQCDLLLNGKESGVYFHGRVLPQIDAIIPRIGPSVTSTGAALIRHFQKLGTVSTLGPDALLLSRDKFQALQFLASRGIPVPKTVLLGEFTDLAQSVGQLGGFPLVLKQTGSTHGVGVILVNGMPQLESTVRALQRLDQQLLLQEFISESRGTDIRAIVVGGKVVAAMERVAGEGEFRANLHLGGQGRKTELTSKESQFAVRSARFLGLEVAGVDFLRSSRGPLLLEVNASPGLEGIESVTRVDVADKIIRLAEQLVQGKANQSHADHHS